MPPLVAVPDGSGEWGLQGECPEPRRGFLAQLNGSALCPSLRVG